MTTRLYRFAIWLFAPRWLRREFGEEMLVVFRNLTRAGWKRRGWWGVVRVWVLEVRQLWALSRESRRLGDFLRSELRGDRRVFQRAQHSWSIAAGQLLREFRFAGRNLMRQPMFAVVAVVVIAVGIGLNAAVFSVAKASIAGALPFEEADRLAVVQGSVERPDWQTASAMTIIEIEHARKHSRLLEDLAVFSIWGNATVTEGDLARRVRATFTEPSYFRLLRATAAIGRTFENESEFDLETVPTVVLSHAFWRRHFGADTAAIGKEIDITGRNHTVIGVMPQWFWDASRGRPDMWIPLSWGRALFGPTMYGTAYSSNFFGLARLAPGATMENARKELRQLSAEFQVAHPSLPNDNVLVTPLRQYFFSQSWGPIVAIFAAAVLVLVICCVNVAALVMLRSRAREREIGLRAAIGGSRLRLAQLVLTETVLLAGAGTAFGVLLAKWGLDVFRATYGNLITRFWEIEIDLPVFVMSGIMLLLVALVCGLYPALRASRLNPTEALWVRSRGPQAPVSRSGFFWRRDFSFVVAVEAALAVVLLVGAGLIARSLHRAANIELGYNSSDLLTMRIDLAGSAHADSVRRTQFARDLVEASRGLRGVESFGLLGPSMLGQASWYFTMTPVGRDWRLAGNRFSVQRLSVTPGAMNTMGIRLLRGRDFTWRDDGDSPTVAVLGATVAERMWPGENAVGKQFFLYGDTRLIGTVVGVVEEASHRSRFTMQGVVGDAYIPYLQRPTLQLSALIRTPPNGAAPSVEGIRRMLAQVDPDVPVFDIMPMERRVRNEEIVLRMAASLTGLYAIIAAVLAFIGTAGLLAYSVRQRRSEIAVRAALGAGTARLVAASFNNGMIPAIVGVAVGLLMAMAGARVVRGLLFGVEPTDPLTYVSVAALVICAAAVACYLPARHAARVEPMRALRLE